ncbi:MAG TPA: hypothetical protein H9909_03105, partial [Candidatus Mediterraneibacter norfolkensis]|nr:hypothetical protein [Candidatus Mediterraneibacter norfolkensis]
FNGRGEILFSLYPIPEGRTYQIFYMSCGISLAGDVLSCLTAEEQVSCSEFRADFQFLFETD